MKLFLIAVVLTLLSISVRAQKYTPVLSDSNTWYIYLHYQLDGTHIYNTSKKEVEYNGKVYKQYGRPAVLNNYGYLREDTSSKILYYLADTIPGSEEIVMCDFSLKQGDRIELFTEYKNVSLGFFEVDTITDTTITSIGKKRSIHLISDSMWNGNILWKPIWTEGIGVFTKPHVYWFTPDSNEFAGLLTCFYNDSQLVYQSPTGIKKNTCEYYNHIGIDLNLKKGDFKIYPNPAQEFISIESNDLEIVNSEFYNLFGELVLTSKNSKSIDISSLSQGIYLMKIKSKDSIFVSKILVSR